MDNFVTMNAVSHTSQALTKQANGDVEIPCSFHTAVIYSTMIIHHLTSVSLERPHMDSSSIEKEPFPYARPHGSMQYQLCIAGHASSHSPISSKVVWWYLTCYQIDRASFKSQKLLRKFVQLLQYKLI